jgi:hypothetical protein
MELKLNRNNVKRAVAVVSALLISSGVVLQYGNGGLVEPIKASANCGMTYGECGENATYAYSEDAEVLIITGTGAIEYNDELDYYKNYTTGIEIEDGITSIPAGFFSKFKNLRYVNIAGSVKSIDASAFCRLTLLDSVVLGEGITEIGDLAFDDCVSLTSVTIPETVTTIGYGAFFGCTALTEVTLPSSLNSLGDEAFLGCSSLESLTIEEGLTEVSDYAFKNCTALKQVVLPDSVTSIGEQAFSNCTALSSVTLPDSLKTIGDEAFFICPSLKEVTIPKSVYDIRGSYVLGYAGYGEEDCPREVVEDFTIYGYTNSEAENYAEDNEFNFVPIGEATDYENDLINAMLVKKVVLGMDKSNYYSYYDRLDYNEDYDIDILDWLELKSRLLEQK